MNEIMDEPKLTFPPSVAEFVQQEYATANVILEYGSGGSTALAAAQTGKKVFSVESDPAWAARMRTYLDQAHPDADVTLHYADIGSTGEWGLPQKYSKIRAHKYLGYARSVWKTRDFVHPDLVLIDGRFRISCFLTCLSKVTRPTRVLFDDYTNRAVHHYVEKYCSPTETVDRMAVFDIVPETGRPAFSLDRLRAELIA